MLTSFYFLISPNAFILEQVTSFCKSREDLNLKEVFKFAEQYI